MKGVAAKEIKRGYVCGPADDLSLGSAVSFTVCLTIVNHPGKVSVGYSPVMYCHTAQFRAKVLELVAKVAVVCFFHSSFYVRVAKAYTSLVVPSHALSRVLYADRPAKRPRNRK